MKILTVFLLTCISIPAISQSEKEINEQVWKPFTKGIMNHDAEVFIALHSKDLVRVERDVRK